MTTGKQQQNLTDDENNENDDRLRDGPCSKQYQYLLSCAERQGLLTTNSTMKEQMQSCPSATDRLIKCIHQHPLYFQSTT